MRGESVNRGVFLRLLDNQLYSVNYRVPGDYTTEETC